METLLTIIVVAIVAYIAVALIKKMVGKRQEMGKGESPSPESKVNVSTPPSIMSEFNTHRNIERQNTSMSKSLPTYPTHKNTSRGTTYREREEYIDSPLIVMDSVNDLMNPLNPLSPLHPLNQSVDEAPYVSPIEIVPQPSAPVFEPEIHSTPTVPDFQPSAPSYEPSSSNFGGGESGGAGAGRSYEAPVSSYSAPEPTPTPSYSAPDPTPSYSSPSSDSGSSSYSSYDSGSSSSSDSSSSSSSCD